MNDLNDLIEELDMYVVKLAYISNNSGNKIPFINVLYIKELLCNISDYKGYNADIVLYNTIHSNSRFGSANFSDTPILNAKLLKLSITFDYKYYIHIVFNSYPSDDKTNIMVSVNSVWFEYIQREDDSATVFLNRKSLRQLISHKWGNKYNEFYNFINDILI